MRNVVSNLVKRTILKIHCALLLIYCAYVSNLVKRTILKIEAIVDKLFDESVT